MNYHLGQNVILTLDSPGPVGITDGLRAYQGQSFMVRRIKMIMPDNKQSGCRGIYYELSGCVSKKGVPYGITEDWLKPAVRE